MKKLNSHLVNALGVIGATVLLVLIGFYYFDWWHASSAKNSSEISFAVPEEALDTLYLPEGHPNIAELQKLEFPAEGKYCLTCHQGIEPTRPLNSPMMENILGLGAKLGDPNGCVVCHGGNPMETVDKDRAHSGVPQGSLLKHFTPVPGSLHINEQTCGQCHPDHVYNVRRSIMNTDAGKMKALTWSFGHDTGTKDHIYGDHDMDDPDGREPRFGTEVYKAYMRQMAAEFPGQFPEGLKQLPPSMHDKLAALPEQASFAYLRNCNACHLSGKGMQDRGHFRGMGCAACHSIYTNEGYYEGGDPSITTEAPGHLMVHSMQGSRKSTVIINGAAVSGVQVSTCAACHSAGRRIGHAYQGLMALGSSAGRGPYDAEGNPQATNAGYVHKFIRNDVHHRIDKDGKMVTGLLCQDCHTTNAMHGNGNIGAATLATIEIECSDCHGTATHYPWELPLGYGDEFGKTLDMSLARGVAEEPLQVTKDFGVVYPREDGYILSARGNPLGNVIRRGNAVIVHSETGHDFEVPLLKQLELDDAWDNPTKARVAMVQVAKHMEKLECYACHSTWAPQYYGYRMQMDFSQKSIDWLATTDVVNPDGTTPDYHGEYVMQEGAPTFGDYSYIRWENPVLGINGEGRVTPLTGVLQTMVTLKDKNGEVISLNHAPKTEAGYNSMELAPLQPHTTSKEARECTDCHGNSAAMGYGVDNGVYDSEPEVARHADVVGNDGQHISRFSKAQIEAIRTLHGDFMQLLTTDGVQVQTIDSHWPASMPLTAEQRAVLNREGTCLACHQDLPDGQIPIVMLGKIAKIIDLDFKDGEAHHDLIHQNNVLISWIKAGGIVALLLCIPLVILIVVKWKKIKAWLIKVLSK